MNVAVAPMAADQFPPRHRNYYNNPETAPKPLVKELPNHQNPHQNQHQKVVINVPDQIVDRKQNKEYRKGTLLGEVSRAA